jgi:Uma2 family endonuclease
VNDIEPKSSKKKKESVDYAIITRGKKYTFADYLTYSEDERWEIIDGVPYMQAAPAPVHQEVLTELVRQMANYLMGKPCKVYPAPFCVRLPLGNEKNEKEVKNIVEPDQKLVSVVVLQSNQRYGRTELYTEDDKITVSIFPDLIIDLSVVFT